MGRRALRRIDRDLDLSRHLYLLEQLGSPLDSRSLFVRQAPLEVEVGSGKGLFLVKAARSNSRHDFLGIEVSGKYARFAAARLAGANVRNAAVVHGDAVRLLHEQIADASVFAVHVYFPDPWWKKRHLRRRVMHERFLRDVERVLEPGGRLHFWTDVEEYFQSTLNLIAASTQLDGPYHVPESPAEHDLDYRTHFERRMRLHALTVYRAEFRK